MEKMPLQELRLSIRAQLLKDTFFRIYRVLELHCRDIVVVLIEIVDEAYIKLNKLAAEILITDGFNDLFSHYLSLGLPDSLFSIKYPDELWIDIQSNLNEFMGSINLICVEVGAEKNVEFEKKFFADYDHVITNFARTIRQKEEEMFPSRKKQPESTQSEEIALFPIDLLSGTRGYLEKILEQVNGAYVQGYYDACSVMLRRLIETLLIECFEQHGYVDEITNEDGNIVSLENLISIFLSSSHWRIGRNSKKALRELPKLKSMGDVSAHNRRYIARKDDIDRIRFDMRVSIEELVAIAFGKNED